MKTPDLKKNWSSNADKNAAFKAWEVLYSDFLMWAKMHLHQIAIIGFLQILLFTIMSLLLTSAVKRKAIMLFWSEKIFGIFSTHSPIYSPVFMSAVRTTTTIYVLTFLASCSVYYLIVPWTRKLSEKGEALFAKEHIRGAILQTEQALINAIKGKGEKCKLKIGNVPWPFRFEPEHLIIFGKTRVGKTVALLQLIFGLRTEKAKGMILDIKLDFTSKFYNPAAGDLIFNVLDKRSVKWNLFNEMTSVMDVDAVAASIIPDAKGGGSNEQFFNDAARAVLVGALHICIQNNTKTNSALREVVFSNTINLHENIEKVKSGKRGAQFIQQPTSALAGSVIAVLTQYCSWLDYLDSDGDFSFVSWLTDQKPGFLYISSNDETEKILRPVISLAFDLVARKVNSLPDNPENRIYLVADELGSLQRLSAMTPLLTKGGGKGLICVFTIQDFAQIEELYGKNISKTILNSFGSVMTLKLKDPETAKYLSEMFGREDYWEPQETVTMKTSEGNEGRSITRQKRDEPIITPTEIQYLKKLEYVLQMPDHNPCRGQLQIEAANNLPSVNEPFILRPGLTLAEVYMKHKEIEAIEKNRGIFKEKEEDLEEDLKEAKDQVVSQKAYRSDTETAARLDIEERMF